MSTHIEQADDERIIQVTHLSSLKTSRCFESPMSFKAFAKFVYGAENSPSKDGRAIVPARLKIIEGTTKKTKGKTGRFRQKAAVDCVEMMIFDCEDNYWRQWKKELAAALAPYKSIVYTSWNHGRRASGKWKPGYPRLRVIIVYARAVSPSEHAVIAPVVAEHFLGGRCDPTTFQPERAFLTYRYNHPDPEAKKVAGFWVNREGRFFEPDSVEALSGKPLTKMVEAYESRQRKRSHDQQDRKSGGARHGDSRNVDHSMLEDCHWSAAEIDEALEALKQDGEIRRHDLYPDWFKVAVSLKDWGLRTGCEAEAFDLFHRWSRGAPNYSRVACIVLWEQLDELEFPGQRGIEQLLAEVQSAGWWG